MAFSDKHDTMNLVQRVVDAAFHAPLDAIDEGWKWLDKTFDAGQYIYDLGDVPDLVEGHRHSPPLPPPPLRLVGVEPNPGPPKVAPGKTVGTAHPPTTTPPKQSKPSKRLSRPSVLQPHTSSISPVISAPVSAISGFTSRAPRIRRTNDRCVISHCELATLVTGTSAFNSVSIPIQPGLASPFPWLSTQVPGWEKYRFRRLRAIYLTRCSASTPGTVIMAPDYDAADSAPASEVSATSFYGSSDDAPWKTSYIDFDMRRSRELFLRNGPLAPNLDIKTYDFANLYVCTSDGTAISWGKVFLDYEIELMNPQTVSATYTGGTVSFAGTMTPSNPVGTTSTITPGSIVSAFTSNSVSLTNLIIGQKYIVHVFIFGTGLSAISFTFLNATSTYSMVNDLANGAGTQVMEVVRFTASSSTDTVTITSTGTTVGGGFCDVAPVSTAF